MDHSLSSSNLDGWQNEPQVGQRHVPQNLLKRVKRYSLWAAIILVVNMVLETSMGVNAIQPMLKTIATDLNEIREKTRDSFYIKGEEEIDKAINELIVYVDGGVRTLFASSMPFKIFELLLALALPVMGYCGAARQDQTLLRVFCCCNCVVASCSCMFVLMGMFFATSLSGAAVMATPWLEKCNPSVCKVVQDPDKYKACFASAVEGFSPQSDPAMPDGCWVLLACGGVNPKGWKCDGQSCYLRSERPLTFFDAAEVCRMNGGSLARIKNNTENSRVDALADTSEQGRTWIGLTNRDSWDPREWIWEGSDAKLGDQRFASWHGATGEPVNAGTQQCAVLLENDWYTAHCNEWLPYVCWKKFEQPPKPPKPPKPPHNGSVFFDLSRRSADATTIRTIRRRDLDDPSPRKHRADNCDAPMKPSDLKNWVVHGPLVEVAQTASKDGPRLLNDFAWIQWLGVAFAIPFVMLTCCGIKYGWEADKAFSAGFRQVRDAGLDEPLAPQRGRANFEMPQG
jgi:hypothetical protein